MTLGIVHRIDSITFANGVPVGGQAEVVLFKDGTYTFKGHFHDSGFPSYKVAFAFAVVSPAGRAFTFSKSVEVCGTMNAFDASNSRDASWAVSGLNNEIASEWDSLHGVEGKWHSEVNVDISDVLGKLTSIAGGVASIIAVV